MEVVLGLFHVALEQIGDGKLPMAKRHTLVILKENKVSKTVKEGCRRLTFLGIEISSASWNSTAALAYSPRRRELIPAL